MTCRQFIDAIGEFVGRDIPPAEWASFRQHLEDCPECSRYLAQYQSTVELVRGLRGPDVTPKADAPGLPPELIRRILRSVRR
jgi:anti-sigma factor RsiW